jgi:transposase-like protein
MDKHFIISGLSPSNSVADVARQLGCSYQAVKKWPEQLPDSAIGRIARLRPDILKAWWRHERSLRSCKRNEAQGEANG